jgi:hypothetical protein
MPDPTTYNGWPNCQTMLVHDWLTTDEGRIRYWREQARQARAQAEEEATQPQDDAAELAAQILADQIEEEFEETNPLDEDEPSVWTDLLDCALYEVRWFAIAQSFLDS